MKKAITILAIIAIVAGAVFAAETHKISVRADVEETLPAFNLSFGGKNTNQVVANVYGENSDVAEPFAAAYDSSSHTENGAADIGFNLNETNSFVVKAEVINAVKTNKSFTIAFKGGVFDVKRNTVGGKLSPSQIVLADNHTSDAIKTVVGGESATLDAAGTRASNPTALTAQGSVTFSGKTGTGTVQAPIAVAKATYSYIGDDSIDPTDQDEWYYADITMTITVNN